MAHYHSLGTAGGPDKIMTAAATDRQTALADLSHRLREAAAAVKSLRTERADFRDRMQELRHEVMDISVCLRGLDPGPRGRRLPRSRGETPPLQRECREEGAEPLH